MKVREYSPPILEDYELSYTSMLCRELDRYLFPNREQGCLVHQPVLTNSCRPDGYGAKLNNDQPSLPILVYDFKVKKEEY